MNVSPGTKATNTLADGRAYPAVAISDPVVTKKTIVNRTTGQPVEIEVTRADFISLRENLAGETYLAYSNETVQYGYLPIAMPRFSSVVGLDADADGAVITLQELIEAHGVSYSAFQAKNFETRRGATLATDL